MRILLAEDETALAKAVARILVKNNYSTDVVYNGADALEWLLNGSYDAAVLDIMMPKLDGISVLRRLRASGCIIPVLLLTAKAEVDDKVEGLDSGANYYLTKPFDSKELLAALRAITRSRGEGDSRLSLGNITLDRASYELTGREGSVRLTNKEFQMLELLMSHPRQIISVESFMDRVWGYDTETDSSVVWVYISYLRKKLAALGADVRIRATRNAGYSLEVENDK